MNELQIDKQNGNIGFNEAAHKYFDLTDPSIKFTSVTIEYGIFFLSSFVSSTLHFGQFVLYSFTLTQITPFHQFYL